MLLDTLVVENETVLKSYYCFKDVSQLTKIQTKKDRREKKLQCSFVSLLPLIMTIIITTGSKEESSHPAADALSVVQDVELVDELVHTVAGLGDGA